MPGPHLGDDAACQHRPDAGHLAQRDHHVVQLQVGGLVKGDGELQRRGVLGPGDQPDFVGRPARAAVAAADHGQPPTAGHAVQARRDAIDHSLNPPQ